MWVILFIYNGFMIDIAIHKCGYIRGKYWDNIMVTGNHVNKNNTYSYIIYDIRKGKGKRDIYIHKNLINKPNKIYVTLTRERGGNTKSIICKYTPPLHIDNNQTKQTKWEQMSKKGISKIFPKEDDNIKMRINGLGVITGDGLATSQDQTRGNVYGVRAYRLRYNYRCYTNNASLGDCGDNINTYHNCFSLGYYGDNNNTYHSCYRMEYHGENNYHNRWNNVEVYGKYTNENIYHYYDNKMILVVKTNNNSNKQRHYMMRITSSCIQLYQQSSHVR
jgi:hypothetical protein